MAAGQLTKDTQAWVDEIEAKYELESHHKRLLLLLGQAWDESQKAAAAIERDGLLIKMPSGARRPHPAVKIRQDARIAFARLLRELDLDVEPPAGAKRPPALRSIVGGR